MDVRRLRPSQILKTAIFSRWPLMTASLVLPLLGVRLSCLSKNYELFTEFSAAMIYGDRFSYF